MSTKSRNRGMTRRQFFRITAITGTGVIVTACAPAAPAAPAAEAPAAEAPAATEAPAAEAPAATEAPAAEAPAAAPSKFKEAPMLADLVKAGSLPPVEERLPANPLVIPTLESIGKYGGTIRRGFRGVSDRWGPTKLQDRALTWFDKSLALQPRLIESWEMSDDAKEVTFRLRPGTKWSDGAPFTTADVKWWYDNVLTNKELTPNPGSYAVGPSREIMGLEVIDENTFKTSFSIPNPLFPYRVTRSLPAMPGHYLKQYHMDTTDDKAALEAEVKEKGVDSWVTYFNTNRSMWDQNPALPTLGPWVATNEISNELFQMQRNPYYFGVDSEGNQLPYLDSVNHRLFETPDVFDLRIVNGEIDFQARHVQTGNFTLYKESEAKGDYNVVVGIGASHIGLNPNHSSKNPLLAEFFQNRDVRIAMNLAMNREEINELVWSGLLKPRQYSPLPMSPQYYEKAETAYIQYDPDEANRLLDAAGYDKKGPDGFRLWKDGSGPVSFVIESIFPTGSNEEDTAQLVTKYLAAVGIQAIYKAVERSLYTEHFDSNDIDCGFWGGDRTVLPLVPEAIIFRGTQPDRPWAAGWARYFNNGPDDPVSVKPPEGHFINQIWAIWEQISAEPNPDKQNELFRQILDIWAEEVPMVTLLGEMPSLAIVKNGFRNFVAGFPNDDTTGDENVYNTETYFWDAPEQHAG